jgi:ABC-type Zn uptake system ZnuABC Zn-binding protein ZnuA
MGVSGRMKGLIDKVITCYEMRANTMGILVANTQKALEQFAPEGEKIANKQAERLDNFVKNLTTDLKNMLTRFYFRKELKRMTNPQTRALADFANFTKTLAKDVRSLLYHFEKSSGQTFEKKFDKKVKQMEAYVKGRLKRFDKALEETLIGTHNTWKERLRQVCQ